MDIVKTGIKDLIVLEPKVFEDDRGYFFESFNQSKLPDKLQAVQWVQDNESKSTKGVLRGLHYQVGQHAQSKLVRAVVGEIYDVAVDIRPDSGTYGHWHGIMLSASNKRQLLIPRGFAHGFVVLSDVAIFSYKCDNYYNKEAEGGIHYNDQKLDISWPIDPNEMLLSKKDKALPVFDRHRVFQ